MKPIKSLLAAAVSLALLSGCGSDSVDEPNKAINEPVNNAPIITVNDVQGLEKQTISISASVEDEGEVSYSWSQKSGLSVSLENADTDIVSFVAPSVSEDKKISLNLIVEDSEGLTSEKNVVVDIKQQLVKLSIEGVATDSPLIEADIKATIGEQSFTTTTTSDGYYTLELALDDDADMSQLVTIEAQGKEQQQAALLQSRLMSFATLKAKAGEDLTLSSDEDLAVNITNFSTAKSALILRKNKFNAIAQEQELALLSNEINPQELIDTAVAIKVILDKSQGKLSLGLPEGVENVLELALDTKKMTDYIQLVSETPEFDEAKNEMLSDEAVMGMAPTSSAKALYFNNGLRTFNAVIKMEGDSSGTYFSSNASKAAQQLTWSISDNIYTFSNPDGYHSYNSSEKVIKDGVETHASTEVIEYKSEVEVLSQLESGLVVHLKKYETVSFPNGEKETYNDVREYTTRVLTNNEQVDFEPITGVKKLSLPMPYSVYVDEEDGYASQIMALTAELSEDGSGTIKELNNTAVQWELVENNEQKSLQLTLLDFDNKTIVFNQLGNSNFGAFSVLSEFGPHFSASVNMGGEIDESENFESSSVPGIYADDNSYGAGLQYTWYELWPNGQAIEIQTQDIDGDGKLLSDNEISYYKGSWLEQAGKLSITRTNSNSDGCYFVDIDPSCVINRTADWQVIEKVDEAIYINSLYKYINGPSIENDISRKLVLLSKFFIANERPIKGEFIPENILNIIGERPPIPFVGLIEPSQYTNQKLFFANHDYWYDEAVESIVFKENNEFEFAQGDGSTVGEYQMFSDGQVVLRKGDDRQAESYGFLIESGDVVIGAYQGLPWPHFNNEADAKDYTSRVASSTPTSSTEHLLGRDIFMVDRDRNSKWVVSYLKFTEGKITIYSDESFTTINTELDYSVDDTGMISFPDNENTMYLSLVTDALNIIVTNDAGQNSKDFNYFLFDHQKAKNFVNNTNALRESALR
ncbi:PKD domain-containing protein [Pseudoalteromonas arctica]|uniref:Ig-like domain-containing protein n=1 Tax=Pseudoalteromonas arctica TaxID=394751 RepID=A0A7Y0DUM9_9GAMM|nr:hypothetical protein [Pseudoalteromonas arctica]NMM41026.1 hypothetical protein [Pseudoalteromonas arctica]